MGKIEDSLDEETKEKLKGSFGVSFSDSKEKTKEHEDSVNDILDQEKTKEVTEIRRQEIGFPVLIRRKGGARSRIEQKPTKEDLKVVNKELSIEDWAALGTNPYDIVTEATNLGFWNSEEKRFRIRNNGKNKQTIRDVIKYLIILIWLNAPSVVRELETIGKYSERNDLGFIKVKTGHCKEFLLHKFPEEERLLRNAPLVNYSEITKALWRSIEENSKRGREKIGLIELIDPGRAAAKYYVVSSAFLNLNFSIVKLLTFNTKPYVSLAEAQKVVISEEVYTPKLTSKSVSLQKKKKVKSKAKSDSKKSSLDVKTPPGQEEEITEVDDKKIEEMMAIPAAEKNTAEIDYVLLTRNLHSMLERGEEMDFKLGDFQVTIRK